MPATTPLKEEKQNGTTTTVGSLDSPDDWLKPVPKKKVAAEAVPAVASPFSARLNSEDGWGDAAAAETPPPVEDVHTALTEKEVNKQFKALFDRFEVVKKEKPGASFSEQEAFVSKLYTLRADVTTFCEPLMRDDRFKSEKEKEMLGKVNVFISNVNVFVDAILASAPQVQKMDGESEAEMKNEVPLYKAEELTIQEKTKQPGCFAKLCCCFFGSNTPKKVRKLKEGNEQGQDLLAGDQRTSDAAPVKKAGGASQPAVQDQTVYTSLDGRM